MPVGHSRTSMNEMLSVENKKAIGNLLDDEETSLVVGKDGVPLLGKTVSRSVVSSQYSIRDAYRFTEHG